ncbi:hypothetical protein [Altererythrobacter litoralis]|uniref:Uncharacterized protein n=1 Tax=Altererythrobacter litoralis TaxID=3113904 RepID=A0ABU7GG17_9SPHN|nr:hypothetical protein [Erythrobacteraceae bacterium 1XM1-14]
MKGKSGTSTDNDALASAISSPVVQKRQLAPAYVSGTRSITAIAAGAFALGALAMGAVAIGALAVGRMAIGRLRIRDARIDRLKIGKIEIDDLSNSRAKH